jgi:TolB-like protein
LAWIGALALAALLAGAGGGAAAGAAHAYVAPDAPLAAHPRLALLPLEDFSGKAETGEVVTRILFSELVRTGVCEVVERGQVDAVVDELRIRDTGSLTADQAHLLSEKLAAPYLMVGSLLESGVVRTPDGDVPAVALALRILDGRTNRVVWADLMARTGEDRETVFGWGREYDANRMTQQMAAAMFGSLQELTAPAPVKPARGRERPAPPADRTAGEKPTGGKP